MDLAFSDLYNQYPFVPQDVVETSINEPDRHFERDMSGFKFEIFVKTFSLKNGKPYYTWILCDTKEETRHVYLALYMLSDTGPGVDTVDPVEMLQLFLKRYGIKSEHKSGKFIMHDVFFSANAHPSSVWRVQTDSDFLLNGLVKPEPHGSKTRIESCFVFAVNIKKYRKWIAPLTAGAGPD